MAAGLEVPQTDLPTLSAPPGVESAAAVGPGVASVPYEMMRRPSRTNAMVWRAKSQRIGPKEASHYTPNTMSYSPSGRAWMSTWYSSPPM